MAARGPAGEPLPSGASVCECNPTHAGDDCALDVPRHAIRVTDNNTDTNGNVGTDPPFSRCAFPFTYNGKEYTSCTTDWRAETEPWCSLDSTFADRWGLCHPAGRCVGTEGIECSGNGLCGESPTTNTIIALKSMPESHLRHAFDLIDVDHSGGLSMVELKLAIAMSGVTASDAELNAVVRNVDSSRDDRIQFHELVGALAGMPDASELGKVAGVCTCLRGWQGIDCKHPEVRVTTSSSARLHLVRAQLGLGESYSPDWASRSSAAATAGIAAAVGVRNSSVDVSVVNDHGRVVLDTTVQVVGR